jgi:hypothetical protein
MSDAKTDVDSRRFLDTNLEDWSIVTCEMELSAMDG